MTTRFDALLNELAKAGVQFVLVGGVAAVLHGSARVTTDVDVVYERSEENLQRLVDALRDLEQYPRGAPPGLPFRWNVATLRAGLNFTLSTLLGALDLLGVMTGVGGYRETAKHCEVYALEGICAPVQLIDLPTLIAAKRAAGRPKDFEVLAELEAILEER